jgi:hypothetical protein
MKFLLIKMLIEILSNKEIKMSYVENYEFYFLKKIIKCLHL